MYYGERRDAKLMEVPPRYRKLLQRAWSGKSRAAGVRAHCLECMGWEDNAPGAVEKCTALACPLFPYRRASGVRRTAKT